MSDGKVAETPTERTRDCRIVITLCEGDFEASMKRKPASQAEFDRWCALAEKGLLNGHIDWGIVFGCATDAMD